MSGCREPASFVLGTAYRKQCNVLFTVSCSYRVEESGEHVLPQRHSTDAAYCACHKRSTSNSNASTQQ